MPTIEQIEAEVDGLNGQTGTIFKFRDAFNHIQQASQTDADSARLRTIMSDFRERIPDLIAFKRIRADARDLDEILMLEDLEERIARIRDRNDLLGELSNNLQTEIKKANKDATLLTRIKDGVEKATKTVEELKGLVEDLDATDGSIKSDLLALIERIGNISSIFEPEEGS
jgi:hypothetical protein